MPTHLVSVDDSCIAYRNEYLCRCGLRILIAATGGPGAFAGDGGYRHCANDVPHVLPGPIYAVWERDEDKWIAV